MIERLACFFVALLICSCAAPPPIVAEGPPPRLVELQEERRVATMHFRPGLYSLDSTDPSGFYYRAGEGVFEHGFAGSLRREGGIFRERRNGKLRGYVVWAGERRKIGNLTRAQHVFRD